MSPKIARFLNLSYVIHKTQIVRIINSLIAKVGLNFIYTFSF
jgi:hypothetical protein